MAIVRTATLSIVGDRTKRASHAAVAAFARALAAWVNDKHGGNQTAAGKELGVSQGHISAMMNGTRGPGLNAVIALREKTGKSADELLGFGPPEGDALVARLLASIPLEVARIKADAARTLEEARVVAALAKPAPAATRRQKGHR